MNNLYVVLNVAVLAGPLALSFDRRVAFYKGWRSVGFALLVVSTAYIVWDIIVTKAGHWSFNPAYSGAFRIAGLPLGELLFFVTVPYACLFVYEIVRAYFPERRVRRRMIPRWIGSAAAAAAVAGAVLLREQGYTAVVMLSIALMLVLSTALDPEMWMSTHTFFFFLLSFALFLLANGILTALPIVEYGPDAIWGGRVYTIPVEDFFYNFGMLGFYLFFYRLAGRRDRRPAQDREEESSAGERS